MTLPSRCMFGAEVSGTRVASTAVVSSIRARLHFNPPPGLAAQRTLRNCRLLTPVTGGALQQKAPPVHHRTKDPRTNLQPTTRSHAGASEYTCAYGAGGASPSKLRSDGTRIANQQHLQGGESGLGSQRASTVWAPRTPRPIDRSDSTVGEGDTEAECLSVSRDRSGVGNENRDWTRMSPGPSSRAILRSA